MRERRHFYSFMVIVTFLLNGVQAGPLSAGITLPKPGEMVLTSPAFKPAILKGIRVDRNDPLKFEFLLDKGDKNLTTPEIKEQGKELVKYFLASITTPEKDLWVNLSPYEKERIVPQSFGQTTMGRDLLAQDYLLKQITASLIYPEKEVGKQFWAKIYEEAREKFGTSMVPVNTFNKVWIVPDKAVVYENAKEGTAMIGQATLSVMLEEDYLALDRNNIGKGQEQSHNFASQVVREVVLPKLIEEVNHGKNFAKMRQVYHSYLLAAWYKKKVKDSIFSKVYQDKNKIAGVNIEDPNEKQMIYDRYLKAFKKGVYNYVKEEDDPISHTPIPRKYFSGGVDLASSSIKIEDFAMTRKEIVDFFDSAFHTTTSGITWGFYGTMTVVNVARNFLQGASSSFSEINLEKITPHVNELMESMKPKFKRHLKINLVDPEYKVYSKTGTIQIDINGFAESNGKNVFRIRFYIEKDELTGKPIIEIANLFVRSFEDKGEKENFYGSFHLRELIELERDGKLGEISYVKLLGSLIRSGAIIPDPGNGNFYLVNPGIQHRKNEIMELINGSREVWDLLVRSLYTKNTVYETTYSPNGDWNLLRTLEEYTDTYGLWEVALFQLDPTGRLKEQVTREFKRVDLLDINDQDFFHLHHQNLLAICLGSEEQYKRWRKKLFGNWLAGQEQNPMGKLLSHTPFYIVNDEHPEFGEVKDEDKRQYETEPYLLPLIRIMKGLEPAEVVNIVRELHNKGELDYYSTLEAFRSAQRGSDLKATQNEKPEKGLFKLIYSISFNGLLAFSRNIGGVGFKAEVSLRDATELLDNYLHKYFRAEKKDLDPNTPNGQAAIKVLYYMMYGNDSKREYIKDQKKRPWSILLEYARQYPHHRLPVFLRFGKMDRSQFLDFEGLKAWVKEYGAELYRHDFPLVNNAMVSNGDPVLDLDPSLLDFGEDQQALKSPTGGIDLKPERLNLDVQGKGGENISFNVNDAMLAQLKDADGFEPQILEVNPVNGTEDLKSFLRVH